MELLIIPLLFEAYITALIFPLLHLILMTVRIPAENKALAELRK
jgi:methyltransferase